MGIDMVNSSLIPSTTSRLENKSTDKSALSSLETIAQSQVERQLEKFSKQMERNQFTDLFEQSFNSPRGSALLRPFNPTLGQ